MQSKNFGSFLKEEIIASGLPALENRTEFEGSTVEELEHLQKSQQVDYLPKIYREFMLEMGQKAGSLFPRDCSHSSKRADSNKEVAIEILQEDQSTLELPTDAFVFIIYAGMGFAFFIVNGEENDDPTVYSYFSGDQAFAEQGASLSEHLLAQVYDRFNAIKDYKKAAEVFAEYLKQLEDSKPNA